MKNLALLTFTLGVLLFSTQACNDILEDPQPSTSISQEIALSDEGAVRSIRASMYNRTLGFTFTTRYFLAPESLADQLFSRSGSTRFQAEANNQVRTGMVPAGSWEVAYDLINDANLLINGIQEGVLPEDDEMQFRGEALAMRAFAHHYLVRGLGYEPGATPSSGQGAGFTLGTVIRTEPTLVPEDASDKPRAEVSEVYAQIKSDLNQAINLLSQFGGNNPSFMTLAGAQALLARVHLYERDFASALEQAQNAIDNSGRGLATPDQVPNMFDETEFSIHPEAIFVAVLQNPQTEGIGVNNALNAYTETQWVAQVPTTDARQLYEEDDVRNAWFGPCTDQDGAVGGCLTPDEEELRKWGGELGNFADNHPYFRVSEMVLIQAEALLNTSGVTPAIEKLNELRVNRGIDALDPADFNSASALDEILEERRREFIGEGHRYHDLKRLQRDLRKAPGTGAPVVRFTDRRILDDIDPALIQDNPALQQNPGF